ncbi:MAG: hypothetical protein HAW67_03880 [Endozoicomonadaceae bacterium]|nr:hypothetical protein [Endozoicomonadaceae bacterium]
MAMIDKVNHSAVTIGIKLLERNMVNEFKEHMNSESMTTGTIDALVKESCKNSRIDYFKAILPYKPRINEKLADFLEVSLRDGVTELPALLIAEIKGEIQELNQVAESLVLNHNTKEQLIQLAEAIAKKTVNPNDFIGLILEHLVDNDLASTLEDFLYVLNGYLDAERDAHHFTDALNRTGICEDVEALEILVKYGANPNNSETINHGIEHDNLDFLKKMHELGTDFNNQDIDGNYAIIDAYRYSSDIDVFLFILNHTNITPDILDSLTNLSAEINKTEFTDIINSLQLNQSLSDLTDSTTNNLPPINSVKIQNKEPINSL